MSEAFIAFVNNLSSVGTLVLQILGLLLIIGLVFKDRSKVFSWFSKNALLLIFLTSFGSVVLSLVYSNVIGFEPCILCWYQRIFIYSTAVISLVALLKKYTSEIWNYILALSVIGTLIAVFHVISQGVGKELIPCPADGPSCLQQLVNGFGYIDIPVMSLTAFIFVILLVLNRRRFK